MQHPVVEDRALEVAHGGDVGMPHRQQDLREPGAAEAERAERRRVDVRTLAQLGNREFHVAVVNLQRRARILRLRIVLAVDHGDDEAVAGQELVGDARGKGAKKADDQGIASVRRGNIPSRQQPRRLQPCPRVVADGAELAHEAAHALLPPRNSTADLTGSCSVMASANVMGATVEPGAAGYQTCTSMRRARDAGDPAAPSADRPGRPSGIGKLQPGKAYGVRPTRQGAMKRRLVRVGRKRRHGMQDGG